MVGYNHIQLDSEVLRQIEEFGFDPALTQKCLDANKHTHETTTYYLLLRKKARRQGVDVTQMLSAQVARKQQQQQDQQHALDEAAAEGEQHDPEQ